MLNRHCIRGYSLPELLLSSALILVLVTATVPAVTKQWQSWQLRQLAFLAMSDINRLRQHAVHAERGVFIQVDAQGWCAGYSTEAARLCTLAQVDLPRSFHFDHGTHSGRVMFSAGRGFTVSGGVTLHLRSVDTAGNHAVRFVISALGRVRVCAESPLYGVPRCD